MSANGHQIGGADPVSPGPPGHRRRRPLGRVRPRLRRADAKGRRRHGRRGLPRRAEDHAGRAEHVARRAAAPARRPARLLDPPGRQYPRSRDRDDAAPALRAPRRVRLRLRDHLSDRGPARAAHQRRRHPARRRARAQHRHRGLLPQAERPDDAGRDHPDAHAGRGDRRARVRDESSSARRSACSAAACRARCRRRRRTIPDGNASRGLVRRAGDRQRLQLRPGVGEVP